jgi:L,D-transpeptidase YbiS
MPLLPPQNPSRAFAGPLPAAVPRSNAKVWLRRAGGLALGLFLFLAAGVAILAAVGETYAAAPVPDGRDVTITEKRSKSAKGKMAAVRPRGPYVVVDTYRNRLHVMKDGKPLRSTVCSTGSGLVLRDPRDGKQWIFDTPTGERTVQRKVKNPIWAKPDWAFIEDGMEPPPSGSPDRFDDFSLGSYGLYMGDGYIIHGTIFQSLLGRRVTHGCIRLGDEDLEFVYKTVPVGARVYLY